MKLCWNEVWQEPVRFRDSGYELSPLALRPIIWVEANGNGVCSVVVPKRFARTEEEILDVGAQVSFLGKSSPPVGWFGGESWSILPLWSAGLTLK